MPPRGKKQLADGEQEDVPEVALKTAVYATSGPLRSVAPPTHTKAPAAIPGPTGTITSVSPGSHAKATAYSPGVV